MPDFTLIPNSFVNYKGNEGLMSNPASRHYWDHDVFTYITSISNPEKQTDTITFKPVRIKQGDTLFYSRGFIVLQEVIKKDSVPVEIFGKDGSLYEAPMKVFAKTGSVYSVTSRLAIAKGEKLALPDTITAENLILQFQNINPDKSIELGVKESDALMKYVTIKAYKFPFILLLWFGVAITAIGILISMIRRMGLTGSAKITSEKNGIT